MCCTRLFGTGPLVGIGIQASYVVVEPKLRDCARLERAGYLKTAML